jgi:DNA repair ATPase RecN
VIENTISTGNILTILAMIASVATLVYNMKGDIRLIKSDVFYLQKSQESLVEAFAQLGKVLTQVAVQDNRLSMMEKRLDELSHGKGFVKGD